MFGDATVVWLDAGGFFGDPTPVGEMQNDTLIEGMNRIGYAAANVGERELAAGVDKFLSWTGKAKFPFVSANLVTDPGGKPFIKPYVVHEIEVRGPADERPRRLRLGIIGFTRQKKEFLGATPDGRNVVTLAPAEAARRWLPELRKKSDLTVALVSMRYEDALEVAQAAQQAGAPLDFILGGMAEWVSRDEGSLLGSTKIVYSGNQGRQLGEVRVYLDGDRRVARSVFDPVWLTRDYPGDPDIESLVQTTMVNINDWYREHQVGGSPLTPIVIGSTYTGAQRCERCHADPFKAFKGSAHFSALETLVKAGQQFNPDCLKCHTTGFGKPGGFVTREATPHLADVQCEACHGPSSGHPEGVSDGLGRSGMGPCLACHTRENSPEFKFPSYWERIRH